MARTTARKPIMVEIQPRPAPATIRAPTIVMPEIAFDPDMSGVWSVGGTRPISWAPRKVARTKMTTPPMRDSDMEGREERFGNDEQQEGTEPAPAGRPQHLAPAPSTSTST